MELKPPLISSHNPSLPHSSSSLSSSQSPIPPTPNLRHSPDDISEQVQGQQPAAESIPDSEFKFDINKNLPPEQREYIRKLLLTRKGVFATTTTANPIPAPGVSHKIELDPGARAVKQRPYRLSPLKEIFARENIRVLLANGLIRPSHSAWASPIVVVPKPGSSTAYRLVIDYRKLNGCTVKDAYPIPRIDSILEMCKDADWITTLDIKDAYHHILMEEDSKHFTAFWTPDGLYEWQVMAMGLSNAPATFQRYVDQIMRPFVGKSVAAYFDDIIIYSRGTIEVHMDMVLPVLDALAAANLSAKPEKCHFAVKEARILGHVIKEGKIFIDPAKIDALTKMTAPTDIPMLRNFLGVTNYYREHIQGYAAIAAPLYDLLKKNTKWEWSQDRENAFKTLIKRVTEAPCLYPPDFDHPFTLQTDASGLGVSVILSQTINGQEHPIGFKSRRLTTAEKSYTASEWECLAIVWGIREFSPFLIDKPFTIITDASALLNLPSGKLQNTRLQRWALTLQEYQFTVVHRPGKDNDAADGLSRLPVSEANTDPEADHTGTEGHPHNRQTSPLGPQFAPLFQQSLPVRKSSPALNHRLPIGTTSTQSIGAVSTSASAPVALPTGRYNFGSQCLVFTNTDVDAMITAQKADNILGDIYHYRESRDSECPSQLDGAEKAKFIKRCSPYFIDGETKILMIAPQYSSSHSASQILGNPRIAIPMELRATLVQAYHESLWACHLGVTRTYRKLCMEYYWPTMIHDVQAHIQSCTHCIQQKVQSNSSRFKWSQQVVPKGPMDVMSMDFTEVPQRGATIGDFRYLLVIVDHFTKWITAIPTVNREAGTVARIITDSICCQLGPPRILIMDNAPEFKSKDFQAMLVRAGIRAVMTPAYHPASNGTVERANGSIKMMIQAIFNDARSNAEWVNHLQACVFAYNTSVHSVTQYTPFFLLYGREAPVTHQFSYQPIAPPEAQHESYRDNVIAERHAALSMAYHSLRAHYESLRERNTEEKQEVKVPFYKEDQLVYITIPKEVKPKRYDKKGLPKAYIGPHRVVRQISQTSYEVRPAHPKLHRVPPFLVHISSIRPLTQAVTDQYQRQVEAGTPSAALPESFLPRLPMQPIPGRLSTRIPLRHKTRERKQPDSASQQQQPQMESQSRSRKSKPLSRYVAHPRSHTTQRKRLYDLRPNRIPRTGTYNEPILQSILSPDETDAHIRNLSQPERLIPNSQS